MPPSNRMQVGIIQPNEPTKQTSRHRCRLVFGVSKRLRRLPQGAYAIALIAADRRLLWRAALFLWMIFLSAMLSTVLVDSLSTVLAASLLPASIALITRLIA